MDSQTKHDVFTYGFSNRTWDETVEILHAWAIELVVNVRTLPGSRRYPHFNKEELQVALPTAGIRYEHQPALGGYRKGPMSEVNASWRNDSFRRYADYMSTPEFQEGLEWLIEVMQMQRTVYVCTEAVYWRCHRALISDALLVRGYQPHHIFTAKKVVPHQLTKFAKVDGLEITYPPI